jgi:Mrp family chromosome partitioning ATPase
MKARQRTIGWIYFKALAATLSGRISGGVKKILVTSGGPREGKSTVTSHLGRALAGSRNEQVLLVDTDWRNPTLHKLFHVPDAAGLGEALKECLHEPAEEAAPDQLVPGDWLGQIRAQERTGTALVTEGGQEFSVLFRKGRVSGLHWRQRPSAKDVAGLMAYLFPNGSCAVAQSERSKSTNGHHVTAKRFEDATKEAPFLRRIAPCIKETDVKNLKVVTCGAEPVDLQDPAALAAFRRLLNRLASEFAVILIDAPPVGLGSPATVLAELADGVLLVVKADGLDVQVIQHAKDELVNAKANVLGVVLNQANLKRQQGGHYYYGAYAR